MSLINLGTNSHATNSTATNSTNTSSTNSTASTVPLFKDSSYSNPAWTQDGVFEFHKLSDLARRLVFGYVGTTLEGPESLALTNTNIYYRAIKGIGAEDRANIPALFTLISTPEESTSATNEYRAIVQSLEKPNDAYKLEIARSFVDRIEMYCQTLFNVKPEDFHDTMGRDIILKREKNKPKKEEIKPEENFAFNLDYALHIARAFNLIKTVEGDIQQNLAALVHVDLTKEYPPALRAKYDRQVDAVEKIRRYDPSQDTSFRLNRLAQWKGVEGEPLYCLPPHIGQLTAVKNLYFSYNNLYRLPEEFENLKDLEWVTFDLNQFRVLPKELLALPKLKEVHFEHNSLEILRGRTDNTFVRLKLDKPDCKIVLQPHRAW